ncbi:hypothetical protein [Micrococcus luteus]|uniref:hypothetical protein n=1 Tax=Micrococcus luteus TaxID=1270 RepID=UPI00200514AD|nr:hypothetical protein [Micrococcus luteus]
MTSVRRHAARGLVALAAAVAVSAPLAAPAVAAPAATETPAAAQSVTGKPEVRPDVVGHRGASGYRPEHTLAAYELAAAQARM